MSDFSRLVTVFRAIIEGQSPRERPSFFRMLGGVPRTLPEKFLMARRKGWRFFSVAFWKIQPDPCDWKSLGGCEIFREGVAAHRKMRWAVMPFLCREFSKNDVRASTFFVGRFARNSPRQSVCFDTSVSKRRKRYFAKVTNAWYDSFNEVMWDEYVRIFPKIYEKNKHQSQ